MGSPELLELSASLVNAEAQRIMQMFRGVVICWRSTNGQNA
jgi:hypothetical protein